MSTPTPATPGRPAHARPLLPFFLIAYGFSWAVWLAGLAQLHRPYEILSQHFTPYLLVGSFGPALAAVVLTARHGGRRGLADLGRSLVRVRVRFTVYLAVLFVVPLMFALCYFVVGIRPITSSPSLVWITLALAAPVNGILAVIAGYGPLGEEPGWRGYALPGLLARAGDLHASVVLGVLWGFWHLPLFAFDDWRGGVSVPAFTVAYPLGVIAAAYMLTKVWRWSHGSVFLAIWFHGILNAVFSLVGDNTVWNLSRFTPLELLLFDDLIVGMAALVFALLARTVFRRYQPARDTGGRHVAPARASSSARF